jgi:hypothetical protein
METIVYIIFALAFLGAAVALGEAWRFLNTLNGSTRAQQEQARRREEQKQLDEITNLKLGAIREMDALSRKTVDTARRHYENSDLTR